MASKKTNKFSLTETQKRFFEFYVTEEFFCNWTKSYMKAYPDASEESARRLASQLLTNIDILAYIDTLLTDMGLNDARVDKELAKLILQDEDKSVKIRAIWEYNKLKKRIVEKKEISWSLEIKDILSSIKNKWLKKKN